jgi:hypothetical protein
MTKSFTLIGLDPLNLTLFLNSLLSPFLSVEAILIIGELEKGLVEPGVDFLWISTCSFIFRVVTTLNTHHELGTFCWIEISPDGDVLRPRAHPSIQVSLLRLSGMIWWRVDPVPIPTAQTISQTAVYQLERLNADIGLPRVVQTVDDPVKSNVTVLRIVFQFTIVDIARCQTDCKVKVVVTTIYFARVPEKWLLKEHDVDIFPAEYFVCLYAPY